ncbi:TonB-dependent siderophore receptor [Rubellimicrobium aerolatum]|uniref:TonB-dependent siderophore receptor n=1 Tax=Rubellimicrobium aerolatum TaxID=490979 RepID=A0ABW0SE64_9RHOB|nr:TonB-dependent siderophore receptor [Rubellimicrobium aerolatum]MBP1806869.1 iron complex outermembrane receptor protein [Rubellimicrobium aerolatum]
MTRRPRLAQLLGRTALVALLPALAAAQEATPPAGTVDLGAITFSVLGADPVGDRANPFTLTGVKTPTPITEVPQSVSVVSAEQVAATNAAKVDEALAYTAGVQAAPYAYDSDTNWIFSRGFDATATGVFLDGLQLYSYAFGGFYIDPFLLERIEVLRGPSSMLYGASNPGGVVNYVSRLPGGEPGALAELGSDTQGRIWGSYDQGGTTSGGLAYRFGAKLQRVDGHGAFEDGLEGVVTGGVAKTFANGGTLTLTASYTGMDEDHVGGAWLPYTGTVEPTTFGTFDEYFNTGEPGYDSYVRNQWLLTGIYRQDIGAWRLTNTTRLARAHVEESSVYAYGYAGFTLVPQDEAATLARIYFQHDTTATSLNNDLRLERTLATGPLEHQLLFGLDAKRYKLDQVQASVAWPDAATGLSAADPVYGAAQPDTTPYIDQELTQTGLGLYAQDQVRWGNGWIATLNGRYDVVHTEAGTNEATGTAGVDREDGEFSWRVGLAKEIGGVVPYVTAGTYFNPQVVNDPAGDEVEPETGRQVEAGVKWSPNERTLLTFAAFETTRENISQTRWNGTGYDYFQLGEVRSRGVELEAQGEIAQGLSYRASVTKLDVEIVDDIDAAIVGNTPYVVIEEQAALSVAWQPAAVEGLTVSAGVRLLGESWVDNENTLKVPSNTLYDAGVSYDFEGGWTASLDISNLTDEDYISACQSAYWCYQGEGRNVSLAVRKSF